MKKYFLIFALLSSIFLSGFGQTSFSISQINAFAKCIDLNCFDKKIRLLGYTFDKVIERNGKQYYSYYKDFKKGSWTLTNSIVYGNGVVDFSQSSIADTDYLNKIKKELELQGFKPLPNYPVTDNGKLVFKYENKFSYLEISDDPKTNFSNYNVCVIRK